MLKGHHCASASVPDDSENIRRDFLLTYFFSRGQNAECSLGMLNLDKLLVVTGLEKLLLALALRKKAQKTIKY